MDRSSVFTAVVQPDALRSSNEISAAPRRDCKRMQCCDGLSSMGVLLMNFAANVCSWPPRPATKTKRLIVDDGEISASQTSAETIAEVPNASSTVEKQKAQVSFADEADISGSDVASDVIVEDAIELP